MEVNLHDRLKTLLPTGNRQANDVLALRTVQEAVTSGHRKYDIVALRPGIAQITHQFGSEMYTFCVVSQDSGELLCIPGSQSQMAIAALGTLNADFSDENGATTQIFIPGLKTSAAHIAKWQGHPEAIFLGAQEAQILYYLKGENPALVVRAMLAELKKNH